MTGLSPRQLEAVFAHELAHIRRRDFLMNIVQTIPGGSFDAYQIMGEDDVLAVIE